MELRTPHLLKMANEVYSFCGEAAHKCNGGRMLILYGPNGCGKTHAARAIYKWFKAVRLLTDAYQIVETDNGLDTQFASAKYVNWPEVVDGFKIDQWNVTEQLMSEYLAVIDDIGAEHDPSRIGIEKLYCILNRREFKYTVLTTNVPPNGWPEKFEQRIASRLFRNSTHIDMTEVPDFNA